MTTTPYNTLHDNLQFGHLTQDIVLPCTTLYVLMINHKNNVHMSPYSHPHQFHHLSVWKLKCVQMCQLHCNYFKILTCFEISNIFLPQIFAELQSYIEMTFKNIYHKFFGKSFTICPNYLDQIIVFRT